MIEDPIERMMRCVRGRTVELFVSEGTEARIRLWAERLNGEIERAIERGNPNVMSGDRVDPDEDRDVSVIIGALIERGLEAAERDDGLVGYLWGEVVSREHHEEMRRRGDVP